MKLPLCLPVLITLLTCIFPLQSTFAQNYPNKPIRLVVTLAPGGTGDTLARLVAENLTKAFGQQVVVENRPGANGIIGTDAVVKSAPDGYTLLCASAGNVAINPGLYGARLPFNVERDLAPVTLIATTTSALMVHPSVPAKSMKDLIVLAKSRSGAINYASAGIGSVGHLSISLLESMAHVQFTHVPYKGSAPQRIAVVAGEVELMFDGLLPALPLINATKLRALGVTTATRSAMLPNLPTIAESGVPGYQAATWYGILAPAGTSKAIIARLQTEIAKVLQAAEVRERLLAQGADPSSNTPEQFGSFIKSEMVKWAAVINKTGAKPD